jgi:hypothetical protein
LLTLIHKYFGKWNNPEMTISRWTEK